MVDRQPVTGIVRDVVVDVIEAIREELAALATDESSEIDVRHGRHVGAVGSHQLWSFEFDGVLPVPPETPGRLAVRGQDPVRAVVLAIGDLDLVLGVEDELGAKVAHARLSVEPWFILDALRQRLEDMLEGGADVALVEALLDLDEPAPAMSTALEGASQLPLALGDDQVHAAERSTLPGLRFVWGPPGTGKTSTLAAAAALLATARDHSRVLVAAHANAAVDVAMGRVADALDGTQLVADGRVLRVGIPHLDVVRKRTEILPDHIIARQQPELIARRDDLGLERRALSGRLKAATTKRDQEALARQLEGVRAEELEIERRLREARVALIKKAAVIGTTLSKLVLDDLLWTWSSRAVIVDEASMSGLPYLLAIAMRGTATLACFGDFRQLPPIAVSDREGARRWFGHDVFELSGVVSRLEAGASDSRLASLRTQYRMGADIAGVVGKFAYFDLLRTDPEASARARRIALLPPAEGTEVVIVDIADLGTSCLQDADPRSFSRFNLLSAALVASIAHRLGASGLTTAGVVSPYRAQTRLLQALLRDTTAVTVATTHRFQGSERDAVLLDLTDADPQEGPSRLTGRDPDLALRLLNVGVSRAKGKLVLVADLAFLTERHSLMSPARTLLDLAIDEGAATVAASDLLVDLSQPPTIGWATSWEEAISRALEASRLAPAHIDVSLGTDDQAGTWLDRLATDFTAEGHTVTIRAPAPIAVRFESTPADLRLRTLGLAPIAFVGDAEMVVGSSDSAKPSAHISSRAAVSAARRLLEAE